jgi:predicted transglutaminase-like cysteine proteinase
MKLKTTAFAALLGAAIATGLTGTASANSPEPNDQDKPFALEFGSTLPPIGYVMFCESNPNECRPNPSLFATQFISLTPAKWKKLTAINTEVNRAIKAASDQELYGKPEHWTLPLNETGDCEDYVLLKKQKLERAGFAPSSLRITVVLDERGDGHAVLTVIARDGDYVLDNRMNEIKLWKETKYTFLKRQSGTDPKRWVALKGNTTKTAGSLTVSQPN